MEKTHSKFKVAIALLLALIISISAALPLIADGSHAENNPVDNTWGTTTNPTSCVFDRYHSGVRISIGLMPKGDYAAGYIVEHNYNPIAVALSGGSIMTLNIHNQVNMQYYDNAKNFQLNSGWIEPVHNFVTPEEAAAMRFQDAGAPELLLTDLTEEEAFECVADVLRTQPFWNPVYGSNPYSEAGYIIRTLERYGFTDSTERTLTEKEIETNTMIFRAFAEVIYRRGGYYPDSSARLIRSGQALVDEFDYFLVIEPVATMFNPRLSRAAGTFMCTPYSTLRAMEIGVVPNGNEVFDHYRFTSDWFASRRGAGTLSTSNSVYRGMVGAFVGADWTLEREDWMRNDTTFASTMFYVGPKNQQGDRANKGDGIWGFGTVFMSIAEPPIQMINLYLDGDENKHGANVEYVEEDRRPRIEDPKEFDSIYFDLIPDHTWWTTEAITTPLTNIEYDQLKDFADKTAFPPGNPSAPLPTDAKYVYNVYKGDTPNRVIEIYIDQDDNHIRTEHYDLPEDRIVVDKSGPRLQLISSHQTTSIITRPLEATRKNHVDSFADKEQYTLGTEVKPERKHVYVVYKVNDDVPPGMIVNIFLDENDNDYGLLLEEIPFETVVIISF